MILCELIRAENKWPIWPADLVYATAILAEESGEAIRAALNISVGEASISDLRKELVQTGAMAVRCLINLPVKSAP